MGSLERITKTWRESVESLVVKKVKLKKKALKQSRIGQRTKDDHESKWVKMVSTKDELRKELTTFALSKHIRLGFKKIQYVSEREREE